MHNDILDFRVELNRSYNELCYSIRKNKKQIRTNLSNILSLISSNMDSLEFLSKEELYMALNVIKIARSKGYKKYSSLYNSEIFQKLDESYAKSR